MVRLRRHFSVCRLEDRTAPATFTVTTDAESGAGSLRQAVLNANTAPGADLVDFSSYFNTPRTITLASQISVTGPVTIDGPSAANVTISGNHVVRIFDTQAAPAGTAISLVDLTLANGDLAGYGGGIYSSDEALTLIRCVFTGNLAYFGGAIVIGSDGSLSATDCIFDGNSAISGFGGAISVHGSGASMSLTRCDISNNYANRGGGLFVTGKLLLESSTISGNTATGWQGYYGTYPDSGGGIFVAGTPAPGAAIIRNSTITGNYVMGSGGANFIMGKGGGIAMYSGDLTVQNSTITGNAADVGGGIFCGTVALESSIVANNGASQTGPDIKATTVNAKISSVFSHAGITTFNDLGGNRPAGEDPLLGPLTDNGGPTKTHRLLPGSPCIDVGSNPANLTTDQRGPGFPRVLNGKTDIGAVEDVSPLATLVSAPPTAMPPGGTSYSVVVRYDDDTGIDLATIDLNDITVSGQTYAVPQSPIAFSVAGSGKSVTVTYTLPAPGGSFDFADSGLYSLAIVANQVGDTDTPTQYFVWGGQRNSFRLAVPGTLVVDEPTDIDDGNISKGHLSLREALRLTDEAAPTTDTITFDSKVFGAPLTITLTAGEFHGTDSVVIEGPGAELLTLDAAGASRHFVFDSLPVTNPVSLSGLTLINGKAIGYGGAIEVTGSLTLTDMVITNCQSIAGYGGGAITTFFGSLTMLDCTISNNKSDGGSGGGGVYAYTQSSMVFERCSFVNNQVNGPGGGLYVFIDAVSALRISECTISGNQAGGGGGGIYVLGNIAANSVIRNSTISGNVATADTRGGGGICENTWYGMLPIANSTITGNSTTGSGGGIAVLFENNWSGPIGRLDSTIIAGNSAATGTDLNFGQAIILPADNNLIGVADSGSFTLTGTGNKTGTKVAPLGAKLGPLADNGGPTKTHALLPGSPAIDAGNNALSLTTDQRGPSFVRVFNGKADIGAFEMQPAPPIITTIAINQNAIQRSLVTEIKLTFSETVTLTSGAFVLERTSGGSAGTIGLTTSQSGPNVTITFNNSGSISLDPGLSLPDGRYRLTVVANKVTGTNGTLDGDGDGVAEGSPTDNKIVTFHRLFGDVDGNGTVNSTDFAAFRTAFGMGASIFDFDNDGQTNSNDFAEFRKRFGLMI